MRIVGGTWRGRAIEAPEGRGTRPTTDRMRETIASMVLSAAGLDLSGAHVLDAFAGSGAMGLELLSRGAEACTFVDQDRKALARVRRNVRALGAEGMAHVVGGDAYRMAEGGSLPGGPFDVVFLDPPYAHHAEQVSGLVLFLARSGQLAPGAIVVYERAEDAPGLELAGFDMDRTRRHGGTCVDLWTYGGEDGQ